MGDLGLLLGAIRKGTSSAKEGRFAQRDDFHLRLHDWTVVAVGEYLDFLDDPQVCVRLQDGLEVPKPSTHSYEDDR